MIDPKNDDQKNLLLAIVLSGLVLIGWHFLYAEPKLREEQARRAAQTASPPTVAAPGAPTVPGGPATPRPTDGTPAAPATPASPGATPMPSVAAALLSRDAALAGSKRVAIATPAVKGSINLRGARIDDLVLERYRETIEPGSKNVVLLSPSGTAEPYYAEFGWVQAAGAPVKVPDATTEWTLATGSTLTPATPVTLAWDNGAGLVFRRTISIDGDYLFRIEDAVENKTSSPIVFDHRAVISRHGTPKIEGFFILHEGLLGVAGEKGLQEITYADSIKNLKDGEHLSKAFDKSVGGWFGITDKYWATALIPDQKVAHDVFATGFNKAGGRKESYQIDYFLRSQLVAPGATISVATNLFAGAKKFDIIERYEATLGIKRFDLMVDWGWFHFFTKPLFRLIRWLHSLLGNLGLAILGVTVLVKAAFFLPANWSYESMAKMKKMQPELERIKERFKDDPTRMRQAQMELMQKENISTVYGCLPMILQIPVFFALYKVLFVTIDMRQAPFFGWIRDLSAADPTTIFNLFGLIPWNPGAVPLIGEFLKLGVWPIIMGVTMWIQMQLNPQQPDPIQQRLFNWMPVMFTFLLASFPAGLIIYWAWSNVLTLIQQYWIMRKNGADIHLWKNLGVDKLKGSARKA